MTEPSKPTAPFDTTIPNAARMYNYWLGGKDNFAADREAAERSTHAVPQLPWFARENRNFLGRAVRFCAGEGVSQFLDIGAGLPTMESVHQVAERITADPHVVYVDHDPVVVTHSRALLAAKNTAAILGDVSRPDEILSDPEVTHLIDFTKPVAILLVAVLHFVPDELHPAESVARLREAMAPGSFLVMSHVEMLPGQMDGLTPQTDASRELGEARRRMPQDAPVRNREQIAAFFGDLSLVEPGLTEVWEWRPDGELVANPSSVMTVIGGVARKT
ncbi:MAG TPA: SAM-dependent methyltransferase [Streptosporangiaceae bacterium]|nr:SAM-dependent methyltransferase [Streptosporangiaceae bacterium]